MYAFAATIFLSAYLLFFVQPLIARFILPWFGGAPAVWTTCMMFFQLTLLAGYFYADWIHRRFPLRQQVWIHSLVACAGLFFLPIIPAEGWKPTGSEAPVGRIVALLAVSVGWPYFVLSTTGPLLQAWFSQRYSGHSPYRLYALSNVGSLLALLGYPFLIEPLLGTRPQAWSWSAGYVGFIGLLWLTGRQVLRGEVHSTGDLRTGEAGETSHRNALSRPTAESAAGTVAVEPRLSGRSWWRWLLLAMVPSILLLAVTNELCQDVAVIPFLWIVPLSLYLVSFIVCFDRPEWYQRPVWCTLLFLSAAAVIGELYRPGSYGLLFQLAAFNLCLFSACMVCHGELARARPPAAVLTRFYLAISLGGALGGLFVVFAAPLLFTRYYELHWSLLAAIAIGLQALTGRAQHPELALVARSTVLGGLLLAIWQLSGRWPDFQDHRWSQVTLGLSWLAGGGVVAAWLGEGAAKSGPATANRFPAVTVLLASVWGTLGLLPLVAPALVEWSMPVYPLLLLGCAALAWRSPQWVGQIPAGATCHAAALLIVTLCGAVYLWEQARTESPGQLRASRDFYGLVSAAEEGSEDLPRGVLRKLYSGRIVHGMQFLKPAERRHPISYYGAISGVGIAITKHPRRLAGEPLRLGVIGLGAGVLAAWSEPEDQLDFFELNRQIRDYAQEYFSYLSDTEAVTRVLLGDGRLLLERTVAEPTFVPYHLLVVDAFSGDSIPRHLLTRECFALYRQALDPQQGILAMHITNGHFDLAPVVLALAEEAGWDWLEIESRPQNNQADVGQEESRWVLLSPNSELLGGARAQVEGRARAPSRTEERLIWTDDFGSPVQLLRMEWPNWWPF
ncbi:MAG: hypothetical protein ACK49R_09995 [Planctomycetota bacterium]